MARSALEVAVVASQSLVMQSESLLSEALAANRLTYATAQALWAIDPDEPAPSMKTVAGRLFCNSPNLSFVMNQLTERGLVERSVDPNDRRSRVVTLTPEGRRVRAEVIDAALKVTPLARLTPRELEQFSRLLATALDAPADAT
ncbi:MarR family winged helix-turn-helix transcriptional regulator [Allonocardiopsis opalescens]|uniref:MarR family winged helix-turn-helix transcriptional regulator n=1 Tax=Allonocardiopsis opalescens TaxID=1144618 RepID=UPI000D0604E2|nr:winged helix DNA-binding protein [Allonocardiopsis opalescens]